jgi:hypothetical protein
MQTFSVTRLVYIQHFEGILAIPNIRGGGWVQVTKLYYW